MVLGRLNDGNNISVNVLGVEGQKIHICRKSKYND